MTNLDGKTLNIRFICSGKNEEDMETDQININYLPLSEEEIKCLDIASQHESMVKQPIIYTNNDERAIYTARRFFKNSPIVIIDFLKGYNKLLENKNRELNFDMILAFISKVNESFNKVLEELKLTKVQNIVVVTDLVVIRAVLGRIVLPKSLPKTINLTMGEAITVEYYYKYNVAKIIK